MSLFVLDTDMLSLFQHGHAVVSQHVQSHPPSSLAIAILTVEEQLSGWYQMLRRTKKPDQLARVYQRLAKNVQSLAGWPILLFSEPAIARFEQLRRMKLRIRNMDLRIAAVVIENSAVLVSRNLRDFNRVPGIDHPGLVRVTPRPWWCKRRQRGTRASVGD